MAKMWFDAVRGHTVQIYEPMAQLSEHEGSSRKLDNPPSYTSTVQLEAPPPAYDSETVSK